MRAVDLIRKKRDAAELTREEIEFLVAGATHDRIPDYQLAAWLMTVLWRGMTRAELAARDLAYVGGGRSGRGQVTERIGPSERAGRLSDWGP